MKTLPLCLGLLALGACRSSASNNDRLDIYTPVTLEADLSHLSSQQKRMVGVLIEAAEKGYATATDLADYLVKKGLPFRDAHEVVGKSVQFAIQQQCKLNELSLKDLQGFSELIEDDVYPLLELMGSVATRDHIGGTAPSQVKAAVARAKDELAKL